MKKYLLDTSICIYFIKGLFDLHQKIKAVGEENCFLSEVTIAELKYGIENSIQKEKNRKNIEAFITNFDILPIFPVLDIYAKEKA
ncbi:MAG: PIN domain-containing protein [Chitinophagaceae bacterium]|nr:PIN domain-containing protein [Chitinophagaceae bacterium]MCW5904322.1 PIN domain-containing protein [Chitinophagaceae bacterium]